MSVLPERGMPRMKIGTLGGIAQAGIALEEGLVEDMLDLRRSPRDILQRLAGRHGGGVLADAASQSGDRQLPSIRARPWCSMSLPRFRCRKALSAWPSAS